jgi:hypothetical protein
MQVEECDLTQRIFLIYQRKELVAQNINEPKVGPARSATNARKCVRSCN